MHPVTTIDEIDLIDLEPIDCPSPTPGRWALSPAFELLAPPPGTPTAPSPRRCREPLWVETRRRGHPPWPDLDVRRLIEVPTAVCWAELPAILARLVSAPSTLRPAPTAEGQPAMELTLGSRARPLAVELTVLPWGPGRVELRLRLLGARLTPSQRHYAMAHDLADSLRAALAPARPRPTRPTRFVRTPREVTPALDLG